MIDALKIGPVVYRVKEVEDLHHTDSDGKKRWLHGHILYADAIIKVAQDQSEQVKVATLWHEALHGILANAGHDEHPEAVITALGYGLVQLIRDNPTLLQMTIDTSLST